MPDPDMAQFTSVFHAGKPNRVRHNRQPVSCAACQRRKSRCDKRHPCGACDKRGEGDGCEAADNKQCAAFVLSEQTAQPYYGATAWSAVVVSSIIQDIQHMLQADSDAETNPEFDSVEEFDQILGHSRSIGIEEIKYSLPSKLLTDRVICCYFSAKFHAVPFIHAHQFRRQYEAFCTDPASTGLLWISLLFSILGAGALLAKAKLANEPGLLASVEEPAFYLGVSARCLATGRYLEGRPGSVEAVLQHAHSRNMQRQDEDRVLWALYGLAA